MLMKETKNNINIDYTMFLDQKNQCCENDSILESHYYPKPFIDSVQPLSNYQWHFPQN